MPQSNPHEGDGPIGSFLRSRSGGSPETVRTYASRLAQYTKWHGGPGIDRESYDSYMAMIRKKGRRPNGIALDSMILHLYADFLKVETEGWQRPRQKGVPVQWLRDNEYTALREALLASPDPKDGLDRAFLLDFLRGTGLRLGEFQALRWRDLDMEAGSVLVRSGKGGKMRVIPLPYDGPPAMSRALEAAQQAFWRVHPKETLSEARLVGDKVSVWDHGWRIQNFLREGARRAGLTTLGIHPHVLRHSFAVDLTIRGVPQAVIQRLLGHASPATTARYQQVSPVDIVTALRRATPV